MPSAPVPAPPAAMEPVAGTHLPDGADWRWQVKWDGIRCLAVAGAGGVRLWSRHGRPLQAAFPEVAAAVAYGLAGREAVLDGELVVLDPAGRPSFPLVLGRLQRRPDGRAHPPAAYALFDLLAVEGRDLRAHPLDDRLARLAATVLPTPGLHLVQTRAEGGAGLLGAVAALGLEGVVAKRAASPYVAGHSRAWQKFKVRRTLEAAVAGYRPNTAGGLRSLCLAQRAGPGWTYLGDVGSGLAGDAPARWLRALRQLPPWSPPFPRPPGRHWVEPRYTVRVVFAEFTPDGRLRAPVLAAAGPP